MLCPPCGLPWVTLTGALPTHLILLVILTHQTGLTLAFGHLVVVVLALAFGHLIIVVAIGHPVIVGTFVFQHPVRVDSVVLLYL